MQLFYVTEPIEVGFIPRTAQTRPAYAIRRASGCECAAPGAVRLDPPRDGRVNAANAYIAINRHFFEDLAEFSRSVGAPGLARLISIRGNDRVLPALGAPPRLGYRRGVDPAPAAIETQAAAAGLDSGRTVRIVVINNHNPAFGDTLAAICALGEMRARLAERFAGVEVDLLQHPDNAETEALYLRSGTVRAVRRLPAPATVLLEYDGFIDLSCTRLPPEMHWVDALIEKLGVDPSTVPAARKRTRVPVAPEAFRQAGARMAALRQGGSPVLLFHPVASTTLRSFPPGLAARFVEELVDRTGWTAATAVPVASSHPRVVDLSADSRSFDHLVGLVAHADFFVSADTCVYHVADAFDVPGVAVFTTIVPELRIAYYPYVEGVFLQPDDNPLLGLNWSEDPGELEAAERMWDRLEAGLVLDLLHAAASRRRCAAVEPTPPRRERPGRVRAGGETRPAEVAA